jgi:hypothetical protein
MAMKKLIAWLVILGLLLIAVTLLRNGRHTTVVVMEIAPLVVGRTTCDVDNHPVVFIDPRVMGTNEEIFTKVHEFTHVRQMANDCKLFASRYAQDKYFRIPKELEAYCAELKERVLYGENADAGMHYIRYVFANIYEADTLEMSCGKPFTGRFWLWRAMDTVLGYKPPTDGTAVRRPR